MPACGTAIFLQWPWGEAPSLRQALCQDQRLPLSQPREPARRWSSFRPDYISSHRYRCWWCTALIRRTVKALDKAQYGSLKTLKCHSTCFRQDLCFVFKGERGLLYIRQSPLIWAFTAEQKPMMQFFLLRISIRNLDLAAVHSFESNWEMQSWCRRRDF